MKKKFPAVFAAFFATANIFSVQIEFPVRGLVTVPGKTVPVTAEWNENWFGAKSAENYNHGLARIAAILSAVSYADVVCAPDDNELLACYEKLGIKKEDMLFHYDVDYENPVWGFDQCAFSFAVKKIDSFKGKRNLIFIVVRGTPLNAEEWLSNLNISDRTERQEEYHEGFWRASNQISNALIAFLLKNKINIDDSFLFITGHSRGAAVANLLAVNLYKSELFSPENIYAYTFASPNVTTLSEADEQKFNFVWNIVNAEDFVTYLPMDEKEWKFKKYGQTKTLVNAWNSEPQKYKTYFFPKITGFYSKFMERDFFPFETGIFVPTQISLIGANLAPNVKSFYKNVPSIKNLSTVAFLKIFPDETKSAPPKKNAGSAETKEKSAEEIMNKIALKVANIPFGTAEIDSEKMSHKIVDMHAMEMYLSWMMMFDENEAFSEKQTNLAVITGSGDYAVFDENGVCMASVLNGTVNFTKIVPPVAANSFLQGAVYIGFPSGMPFSIFLNKESLIPSKIKIKNLTYSASGKLLKESDACEVSPNIARAFRLSKADGALKVEKLRRKESNIYKTKSNLKESHEFKVTTEVSLCSTGTLSAGVELGTSNIYGAAFFGGNIIAAKKSLELGAGIGSQCSLINKILLNSEIYSDFLFPLTSEKSRPCFVIPKMRFSLSFKPKHSLCFFAGVNVDFKIEGFNDEAFSNDYRFLNDKDFVRQSKVHVAPSFQFGVRF